VGPGLGEGIGVDEEAERGVASSSAQMTYTPKVCSANLLASMNARKGTHGRRTRRGHPGAASAPGHRTDEEQVVLRAVRE
jgi:hypothetical protein